MVEANNTQKKEELTQKKFDKIMLKFLLNEPFFSDIIQSIRREKTRSIPTAGVSFANGSITLYWNPDFVSSLPTKHMFGLLKHECYHLIYQHVTGRKQKPHLMWNIATDLAINSTIPLDELPEGGLIPGQLPNYPDHYKPTPDQEKMSAFIASMPLNKSSEWYMEQIMSNDEIQKAIQDAMSPPCTCSSSMPMSGSGNKEGKGKGEGEGGGKGEPSEESCPTHGNGEGTQAGFDYHFNEDLTEAEKAMADSKIKNIIKEAMERADKNNSWGSVSAGMAQRIKASLVKEIDWKSVLKYFCGTKQKANRSRTFKKINRKYPYIHPGRKSSYTSNIAIYIDQSGSVDDGSLTLLFSALNDLASRVTFTIYHFDCDVDESSEYVWKKKKRIDKPYRTRGGGTNFDSVENHFRKVAGKFDGYVIMTDGYAPKPKTCISKRCWVLLPGIEPSFPIDKRDTVVKMKRNHK